MYLRGLWKFLGIVALLAVVFFGAWSYMGRAAANSNYLEASYQRSFYNMLSHVENIDTLLAKSLVSSSPKHNIMNLTTVWHEAESARQNLIELPIGLRLQKSSEYLAQTGDFTYYLAKKYAEGKEVTDEEWNQLKVLRSNIKKIDDELHEIQGKISTGKIRWGSLEDLGVRKRISNETPKPIGELLFNIDEQLQDLTPMITYDGPFSDQALKIKPRGLTGPQVTREEAEKVALQFVSYGDDIDYTAEYRRTTHGNIPGYSFVMRSPGDTNKDVYIDISQKGGHVVWMINSRTISSEKISVKEAIDSAKKFIDAKGPKNMVATGSIHEDNMLTVTFCVEQQDVLIYTDFVKVAVALDNGDIVGYDAQGYLTAHKNREFPESTLSEAEIRKKIKPELTIDKIRKAIIPSPGKNEILTYEVQTRLNQEKYFIYLNAVTGEEETIMQVLETKSGTLVL
jgi:spore germination protein